MTVAGVWGAPSTISNVSDAELDVVRGLFDVWGRKRERNVLRSAYFDGKMPLKPTGNIPVESMRRIEAVLDWPEKAVSALAERSVFEGFVSPGGERDPYDLGSVLDANRFGIELPQAIASAYTHSCSFITTARGDVQSGEPEVVVSARSAEWSSALWDSRRRVISAALAVTGADELGEVHSFTVYLPDVVLRCRRSAGGLWSADRQRHRVGRVLVEPIVFDPQLDRPFGRSRISRAVMNITDHALATIVRTEISADFFSAPRMYALGVAEDAFQKGKWEAAIDRWFAITRDEDGELPSVGQFAQISMQPLTDLYRMYATQFSGATGVPVANLGITTDNPASAEALYADDRRLVNTARRQNKIMAESLKQVAQKVVQLRDGVDAGSVDVGVSWANPAFTSPVTAADALVKLVAVFPWLSESEVALEYAGFSNAEITRLLSDKRRAQGGSVLSQVLARQTPVVAAEGGLVASGDGQG